MKYIYRLYQLCVVLPLFLLASILTALVTVVGCLLGNGHFWGYYPGKCWSRFIVALLFLPVKVEGRENLRKGQSYVFVANHQGAFDIFLIYGFLNRNFKWMMKRSLRKVPFVGMACQYAHHIFVDRRSRLRTMRHARCCATACRWWSFPKAHGRSRATWASSVVARLCWPTSCNCLFAH